jgi:hypothetical protein
MLTIHVARSDRQSGAVPVHFKAASFGVLFADIALVGIARRQDLIQLSTDLYRDLDPTVRSVARVLVLRAHDEEAHALTITDSKAAARLAERFPGTSVYVLHRDRDGHILTKIAGQLEFAEHFHLDLVRYLREAELRAISEKPSALLPESTNFHYVGPSGRHYRSFLRVGTAIQSAQDLDAVCFWVLPFLQSQTIVVLDSPTLIALGFGLAQYARDSAGTENHSVHAVEVLDDSSAASKSALEKRLLRIVELTGRKLPILCLSSVFSSGRTFEAMLAATASSALDRVLVGLYKAGQTSMDPQITFLADAPSLISSGDPCTLCEPGSKERSARITIDPISLHVNVGGAVVKRKIKLPSASSAKDFLDRYVGRSVIRAHYTESDGHLRHHAINIDVAALMKVDIFRQRLRQKLEALRGQIDTIICPSHAAARQMAAFAREVLGIEAVVADENKLSELPETDLFKVRESKSLLILDDVAISGDRIRGYRSHLFELGRPDGDVHVLVGVSRPPSMLHFEGILNLADQMTPVERSFHDVERVWLPNWDSDDCPWCIEERLISDYPGFGDHLEQSERMIQRAEYLGTGVSKLTYDSPQTTYAGIEHHLFWSSDGSSLPLGAGSIFAPADATEAELFFAVASAIQNLRSSGDLDEEHHPPIAKVLIPEFWAHGRFYAPAITAAILRAARPHDLLPPQPSPGLKKSVSSRLSSTDSHALTWEILLAIGQRKLPPPDSYDDLDVLKIQDPIVLDLLAEQIDGAWASPTLGDWLAPNQQHSEPT